MQSHYARMLSRFEVPFNRVRDHVVQLFQSVALRCNPAFSGIVPTGNVSAGFITRRHLKSDFFHDFNVLCSRRLCNGKPSLRRCFKHQISSCRASTALAELTPLGSLPVQATRPLRVTNLPDEVEGRWRGRRGKALANRMSCATLRIFSSKGSRASFWRISVFITLAASIYAAGAHLPNRIFSKRVVRNWPSSVHEAWNIVNQITPFQFKLRQEWHRLVLRLVDAAPTELEVLSGLGSTKMPRLRANHSHSTQSSRAACW